jgi:anti-sigma regulatory factor (Ser/Thr protein kinase)
MSSDSLNRGFVMRELSHHILDLIENSVHAGASVMCVSVIEDRREDTLKIILEDNGPGLSVAPEVATGPFYTTSQGKRTGLGLSLFRAAAEQAGGMMRLGRSELGGVSVEAVMQLSHIDRTPLGDLPTTLSTVVCTNPDLDLVCCFIVDGVRRTVRVRDVLQHLGLGRNTLFETLQIISKRIESASRHLSL